MSRRGGGTRKEGRQCADFERSKEEEDDDARGDYYDDDDDDD